MNPNSIECKNIKHFLTLWGFTVNTGMWSAVYNEPKMNQNYFLCHIVLIAIHTSSLQPLLSSPAWIFFSFCLHHVMLLHLSHFSSSYRQPFKHLPLYHILECRLPPSAAGGWQRASWLSFNGPPAHLGSSVSINRDQVLFVEVEAVGEFSSCRPLLCQNLQFTSNNHNDEAWLST